MYSLVWNQMSQVMYFFLEEIIPGLIEFQSCSHQLLKNNFNLFTMFLLILTEDDDVMQVGHYETPAILQNH